ncbi:ABC transporter substrate-binding protein [Spongorhabdus nitratireducens]
MTLRILLPVLLWCCSAQLYALPGDNKVNPIPERIAALNWTQAEFLLTLGITPAGVTTIKGYRRWQTDNPPLPQGVTELGHRAEPSLEALRGLKPDLILGYNWRHQRLAQRLQAIAPTLLFSQYPSESDSRNYLQRMQDNYLQVAEYLGRVPAAKAQLVQLQQVLSKGRQQIADAGLSGETVIMGKFVGMGLGLRVFGEQSLAGAIMQELGLKNGWNSTLPGRDFTHIDLLQLPAVGNATLLLNGGSVSKHRSMTEAAVWQQLPAVKEDRVYLLPSLWSYGGPESAIRMVEEIVRQLTGSQVS